MIGVKLVPPMPPVFVMVNVRRAGVAGIFLSRSFWATRPSSPIP